MEEKNEKVKNKKGKKIRYWAIIIISLIVVLIGIKILKNKQEIMISTALPEFPNITFNTTFTQYAGDQVRATVVKSLLIRVQVSNKTRK